MIKDLTCAYMSIYNGKFGGGGMMQNPMGFINDGLFELVFNNQIMGKSKSVKLLDESKKGGIQIYCPLLDYYRCKNLILVNKS